MRDALPMVFTIADDWMWQRHVLTLLGGDEDRPLDAALAKGAQAGTVGAQRRARQDLAEQLGGEVVIVG